MFELSLLFIIFIGLWIGCIQLSGNILLTPQFLFLTGFIIEVSYAFLYINKFSIYLSDGTVFVLISGSILFLVFSFLASRVKIKYQDKRIATQNQDFNLSKIDKWKYILCLFLQLMAIAMTIRHLRSLGSGTLSELIYLYRSAAYGYTVISQSISTHLPVFLRLLRRFSVGSGFLWAYLLAWGIVNREKNNRWLIIINLLLSAVCDLLLGGRKGSLQVIISGVIMFYVLNGNKNGWNKKTKFKMLFIGLVAGLIFLSLFSGTAQLIGRKAISNNSDYLANYLAAPLKNLDLYISSGRMGQKDSFYLSLPGIAEFLTDYIGVASLNQGHGYPNNHVNGYNIANAYTTYYAFLHDYGIWGVFLFMPIMGWLSQKLLIRSTKDKPCDISISIIIYGYAAYGVFLAFFDNTFFISLVSVKFAEYFIFWLILRWFMKAKIHLFTKRMRE